MVACSSDWYTNHWMQFRYSAVLGQVRLFLGPKCVPRDDFQGCIHQSQSGSIRSIREDQKGRYPLP